MSVRENLELDGMLDPEPDGQTLARESGAAPHPSQTDAYVLDGLPFHAPRPIEDHISILSFNNLPLPDSLIEALVDHPELFPDDILVRWTQQQDLDTGGDSRELRGHLTEGYIARRQLFPLHDGCFTDNARQESKPRRRPQLKSFQTFPTILDVL